MTKKIVILDGGTAGWMAANLFVRKWSEEQVSISLIESPDIGIIGVGEGSTPTLRRFFEIIEVADAEWMPRCNATYKVNIRFAGWSPDSGLESYSHLGRVVPQRRFKQGNTKAKHRVPFRNLVLALFVIRIRRIFAIGGRTAESG